MDGISEIQTFDHCVESSGNLLMKDSDLQYKEKQGQDLLHSFVLLWQVPSLYATQPSNSDLNLSPPTQHYIMYTYNPTITMQ